MPLTTVGVNGVPVETYTVTPIDLARWLAPPEPTYASVDFVNRVGGMASVRGRKWKPRELSLGIATDGATPTASRTLLAAWYRACQGMLEIEVADAPGKVCYGVFEGASDDVFGIKLLSETLTSIGKIVCHDPIWYDRSPITASAAAATRVAVPVGDHAGIVKIAVIGAATNPTVTLRDRTGAVLEQMRFTVTLGATELLEIDTRATWPVTKWTAGVVSDAFATLNVADVPLFTIDPLDGPTLETSTGVLMITTWRGYLT